jgi:adenylate cyclase
VLCACTCALEMIRGLQTLNLRWQAEGRKEIAIGIGLNTGPVNVGNMGSPKRLAWTVMGDNVNLASRLEGMTKQYRSRIVISEGTHKQVAEHFVCRELDRIRVKGKHQPVVVYELMDVAAARPKYQALITRFESAMEAYHAQDWRDAAGRFGELLVSYPEDGPTQIFLQRALEFMETAPEPDWDGVYVMKSK